MKDLGEVQHDSAYYYARFEKAWIVHKNGKHPLARSLKTAFLKELLVPLVPTVAYALLLIVSPLNLSAILGFLK